MAERHEEKYFITYQQYAQLKERAMQTMVPDVHGVGGSYMITSLYYDDPTGNSLMEKLEGLAKHTKFRLRTYDFSDSVIRLERKVKEGILTQKQSVSIAREQLTSLDRLTEDLAISVEDLGEILKNQENMKKTVLSL